MRIALLSYTFPRGMGYIGNMLPRYLARLGAEVHYITMDLPHYFQSESNVQGYGTFEGMNVTPPGSVETYDGFTLHGLGHRRTLGQMRFVGLYEKLKQIRPHVVQSFLAIGWPPLQAVGYRRQLNYRLFTANHTTASVFPLAQDGTPKTAGALARNMVARYLPGRFISRSTDICYAATVDCADVATRFFGVEPEKTVILPLGVDTEQFRPVSDATLSAARSDFRSRLGIAPDEVVFIYTGQFTESKNPLLLSNAIEVLRAEGALVRGLFVGDGVQGDLLKKNRSHSVVVGFVPNSQLPNYYRAADVGVWPTQESTSMLDAAACGLPIVVNDTLRAVERISGNGVTYRLNNLQSLVEVLRSMLSADRRIKLGVLGAQRMEQDFSWRSLAAVRLRDYERFVVANSRAA